MQGEEWDDSMTSIRRIVPKTNEQYVARALVHCGQKKFRKESIYPFIAPSLGTTLLLSSTIFMFLLGIK